MNRILVLLLATGLVAACSLPRPPRPEPPQPPPDQAFSVTVHDFVTPTRMVPGVAVVCDASSPANLPQLSGTTNDDGFVSFVARSFEVYNCTLTKEGYEDNTAAHYVEPNNPTLATWIKQVPPTLPPGLQGRLRIQGNCLVDDTGCVLPIYAHMGDGFSRYVRDPDFVRRQLDLVAGAGYHGLRVWAVLGGRYWEGREVGPGVTPDYWGQLNAFFNELKSRNLRAVWSMGDIGYLQGSRQDYMRQLAGLDNGLGGVIDFLDCGNEAYQTGEPDPRKLSECVGYYKSAGGQALLTLTSPTSEEKHDLDAYSIPPADLFDVHGFRGGHFWDKIRHIFSIAYEIKPARRFGIQSEPFGNGGLVSVTSNKDELNGDTMAISAIMSNLSRQVWVWFSGEGVILQRGLETQSGFYETPRAVQLLPKDMMTFPTLHHSGTTWVGTRILVPPTNDVRIDGAQHPDGRAVEIIYGPPGNYRFQVVKNFVGQLCEAATAACREVTLEPHVTFEQDFSRGLILIGRTR